MMTFGVLFCNRDMTISHHKVSRISPCELSFIIGHLYMSQSKCHIANRFWREKSKSIVKLKSFNPKKKTTAVAARETVYDTV